MIGIFISDRGLRDLELRIQARAPISTHWSPARVAKLTQLINDYLSAAEIADSGEGLEVERGYRLPRNAERVVHLTSCSGPAQRPGQGERSE